MSRIQNLNPIFSDKIPEELAPGILYISMNHRVAKHLCPCGCGEVITIIFDPELWKLKFDGETVSIFPSIGNYNIPCQSHYFITDNKINWCQAYTDDEDKRHRKHSWFRHFRKKRKKH